MLGSFFEKVHCTFAEETDKLFWARLKEKTFEFVGKRVEQWESIEILCVHRPKILAVPVAPGYKFLREWIQCLYNDVIDRQFVATSQSLDDPLEQILRLNIKQLALIRVPIVH